jgi:transposase
MRCELSDEEWAAIKPMPPNKPRGVPRVYERRVLHGIFWVLRWRDLPNKFGPYTSFAGDERVSGPRSLQRGGMFCPCALLGRKRSDPVRIIALVGE